MDLAELKFVVKTEQLEDAAKKISALGDALSKVNKPTKQAAIDAEKLALAQAAVAKKTAEAEEASNKAALSAAKLSKATDDSTGSSKNQMSILEKQILVLENMAQGYSKGQASVMASYKAAGALDDQLQQLGETLKAQKSLVGSDPFDKSAGAIETWTNRLKTAVEMDKLYSQGLGLTKAQLKELAIEKQKLITLADMEGKTTVDAEAEYKKLIGVATTLAQQENTLTAAMRNKDKAMTDAAKAAAYVADADARLAAALDQSNSKLDKAGSDALVKYEKNLRLMGLSTDEAAVKLSHAKTQFDAIADKKQADKLQYLARAISVQMGDVGISLASGMNPLLVMIQQGDQIRGAIQQAGASGKELEKAMAGAATQIATSFMQTAQAMGGFFVNAIKSAAAAILGFPFALMKEGFLAIFSSSETATVALERLKIAALAFGKVGIVAILTALVALGAEYVKVAAAQKELTVALATNSAGLGLSTQQAQALAESMASVGVSTLDAMRMIGEFADTGANASIPLQTLISSAKDMEKYVGIASKDTMKAFADITEKPVEGLIKLAKTTGNVSAETILQAEAFMKSGKEAEAARVAQEALAASNQMVVNTVKNNLDPLQTLWIDIKSAIGSASQAMYDLLKSEAVVKIFRTAWETVAVIVSEVWYTLKQTGIEIAGIGSQIAAVMRGDFAGAAAIGEKMKADADIARKAQDELVASILNRNSATKDNIQLTEAERQANKKAAKEIEDRLKNQKAATFKVPEDTGLKKLQNDYKNNTNIITAESNRLITENKVAYALGLKDTGDYITSEIALITEFNNKKISENDKYIEDLNKAEASQIEAITKAMNVSKSHAKSKEDILALDKQLTESLKTTTENYTRLKDTVKATNEQLADKSAEAQMKAIENLGQYTKKVIEGSKDFARSIDDTNTKRKLQIDLENQLSSLSGGELARVKAQIDAEQNHIAKLSELQDAANKAADALAKLNQGGMGPETADIAAANSAALAASLSLEQAKAKSREEIVQAGIDAEMLYYTQEYNKLKANISDALVTALVDGGAAGSKKLRDIIIAELKKPITVVVNAMVNTLMGNTTGASGGTLLGNMASSFLGKTLGSISVGGSTLAAAGEAFGTGFMTTLQGGSVAEAAGIYGSAGMSGVSSGLSAGASVASAIPYVAGALLVANALGLFRSTEQRGSGITGTLGSGNINSYAVMRESGTLFSGPDWWTEDKGKFGGSDALQQSFQVLKDNVVKMATSMNLSADSVKTFTKSISISFDGLTSAQIQDKIATTFSGIGDELAALVLGVGATAAQLTTLYNNVMQQRYDLETQLLTLQGNTAELRKRERATIYASNQALYDQVKALEDQKAANEAAAVSIKSVTDEINRLRGVDTSQAGLESQFAILTAQARAGDLTALNKLPDITKGLENIAGATAVNATDIVLARARLAQSLQDTLGYVGANGFIAPSVSASTPAVISATGGTTTVSAASSNQELLNALVTEIQGLRAEVRADVSHNAKTAKILERVNQDGETLSVTTV